MNLKPNLFIVGAMKAGTTSFVEMLAQHPDIYFSPVKEPHFFVKDLPETMYAPSRYFDLDTYLLNEFPKPLHIAHLQTEEQYDKIFSLAPKEVKYLAEASTGYLHAPESATLIHQYNPDAKIIILTRDPLKRAYSHYKMNMGLGRVTESFETLIQSEIQDFNKNGKNPWNHLGMSMYENDIARYTQLFGQQVLIIPFEKLIQHPKETKRQLIQFLAIGDFDFVLPHENASKEIKYKKLVQFLYNSGLKDLGSKILPKSLRKKVFKKLQDQNKKMTLAPETSQAFYRIIEGQEDVAT